MKTDKPTPPEGYEVMLGKDLPSPIPKQTMFWCADEWEVSDYCGYYHLTNEGDKESWYGVPVQKPLNICAGCPICKGPTLISGHDPKKSQGEKKPQLQLIPPALNEATAQALQNGATKYGAWNWRENKVEMMTYLGAIRRHLDDFLEGENLAPDSGVHHLGHIAANCGILLDADKHGMLVDNRPGTKQTA